MGLVKSADLVFEMTTNEREILLIFYVVKEELRKLAYLCEVNHFVEINYYERNTINEYFLDI